VPGSPGREGSGALHSRTVKRAVLYGLLGGVLIVFLELNEYAHFVRFYRVEVYGGLLAVVFTALGLAFGLGWSRRREVVVVREVPVRREGPFVPAGERLRELGITEREHEILTLVAEGLSNREIGERLFISENTVKTHTSRLFGKLGVQRRVQAVQRGRELDLVP